MVAYYRQMDVSVLDADERVPQRCTSAELAHYWQHFGIEGEVLEALEGILYDFGENAAAATTDVVLLMQSEHRSAVAGQARWRGER